MKPKVTGKILAKTAQDVSIVYDLLFVFNHFVRRHTRGLRAYRALSVVVKGQLIVDPCKLVQAEVLLDSVRLQLPGGWALGVVELTLYSQSKEKDQTKSCSCLNCHFSRMCSQPEEMLNIILIIYCSRPLLRLSLAQRHALLSQLCMSIPPILVLIGNANKLFSLLNNCYRVHA